MLQNIPQELRERKQWVVWKYEAKEGAEKPTKRPYNPAGYAASTTSPSDWVSFDDAQNALWSNKWSGLGFVLAESDPYAFIDLDTYDPKLSPEDKERHAKIAQAFAGYAELSPSGQGLHLIVKGSVEEGRKRSGVEIYSDGRYMTCTGNVWRAGPILEQQPLLTTLWEELKGAEDEQFTLTESKPETIDDWTLCERAAAAVNGSKFTALYRGEWQASYASQSEADFALVDIIAFYTDNHAQVARIFRASALGQREKAHRNTYLFHPRYGIVTRAFDHKPPQIDMSALFDATSAFLSKQKLPAVNGTHVIERVADNPTKPQPDAPPVKAGNPEPQQPADEVYSLPPGLLGEIAAYVYASAPRPVPEIALCAAIGLMAGITGRSYNISGTGLNHYVLLLAATGSGKEAIADGISRIMNEVKKRVPAANDFIGPGEIRSDAALLKYIAKRAASFVTVGGEFGHTLAQMAGQNANAQMKGIKRVMLDLYGKSGQGAVLRPTIYSDADKNSLELKSPAFSFIGESAPESFYNSVDESLVADGLLPRFTLIEYNGKRPDLNVNAHFEAPEELVEHVAALCAQSLMVNNAQTAINVQFTPEADTMLKDFDRTCTSKINDNSAREVIRHLWNRAHLRALKLAGLVAVGINPFNPVVTVESAQWAIRLSSHNTQKLLDRFEAGDVGADSSDSKQLNELRRMLGLYYTQPFDVINGYLDNDKAYKQFWISKSYFSRRLIATAAFKHDRRGASVAISAGLKTLCELGELFEVPRQEVFKKIGGMSTCFALANEDAYKLAVKNALR